MIRRLFKMQAEQPQNSDPRSDFQRLLVAMQRWWDLTSNEIDGRLKDVETAQNEDFVAQGFVTHNIDNSFGPADAIPFETIIRGAKNWNPATNIYTAPKDGWYLVTAMCRAVDSQTAGKGFGISITQDFVRLSWAVTPNNPPLNRCTVELVRRVFMNKGTQIQLLGFSDASGGVNVFYRSFEVTYIGP